MQKEFTVNGVQYLAVEVPEHAKDFRIEEMDGPVVMFWYNQEMDSYRELPEGSWEIVGKVKGLTRGATARATKWGIVKIAHNLNDNDLILKIL